jgi:hypothetical protein
LVLHEVSLSVEVEDTNHGFVERMVVASARTDLYERADLRAALATGRASTWVSRSIVSNGRRLDLEHALPLGSPRFAEPATGERQALSLSPRSVNAYFSRVIE